MTTFKEFLSTLNLNPSVLKNELVDKIQSEAVSKGYAVVEINNTKPWGAYLRFDNATATEFIGEFFPGLTINEARLEVADAELSPKILLVSPGQRLSWQLHDRRAERWSFLSGGGYYKSMTDEQGEINSAEPGDVVQFQKGERHRLVGAGTSYTLVAEIWQHTDTEHLSNEDDIVRIADDYQR